MEREVAGACPLDCPDGCSWIVTVRDGEAVRLRGTPDHPFTRGALCNKVARYLDHTRSPDRLLRRVGAKGEGRFERISWDDVPLWIEGRRIVPDLRRPGQWLVLKADGRRWHDD